MNWLLLIATLPGQAGSLRLRFWRQLKGVGAANLRDGVYLLPGKESLRPALLRLRDELLTADGSAWLLDVPPQLADTEDAWRALFDRADAYREWRAALNITAEAFSGTAEGEARRQLRQLRKDLEGLAAIDYFPGEDLRDARRALTDAEQRLTRQFSPDEPLASSGNLPALSLADYQGRLWATRARPWVDRVASAWLIRRFIDPQARFIWLPNSRQCPPEALGFDFDGARFTHVDDLVTFEVLLAGFSLDKDPALRRLGLMVHALDVGGDLPAEAPGFEAMLSGARQRLADDDQLLAEIGLLLDSLYAHYRETAPGKTK